MGEFHVLLYEFIVILLGQNAYPKIFSMINKKHHIGCKEKNVLVKLKNDPPYNQSIIMSAFCRPDCINQLKKRDQNIMMLNLV